MPSNAWTPLANVTLGSTASSVTFSSIAGTYRDLVVVMQHSGAGDTTYVQFNSDTNSANYSFLYMLGNGSSASSTSGTRGDIGATYTSNLGNTIVNIFDYSATDKHKTVLSRSDTAANNTRANAVRWANTAAITSVKILVASGSFDAGSTFALYGISS